MKFRPKSILVFSIFCLYGCEAPNSSLETPKQNTVDLSASEFFSKCENSHVSEISQLNPVYVEMTSTDIITVPSQFQLKAFVALKEASFKKIDDPRLFGIDVGNRDQHAYLVKTCLQGMRRQGGPNPFRDGIEYRVKSLKIGWNLIENHDIIFYQQFVLGSSDELTPITFVIWTNSDIAEIKGSIFSHHP